MANGIQTPKVANKRNAEIKEIRLLNRYENALKKFCGLHR